MAKKRKNNRNLEPVDFLDNVLDVIDEHSSSDVAKQALISIDDNEKTQAILPWQVACLLIEAEVRDLATGLTPSDSNDPATILEVTKAVSPLSFYVPSLPVLFCGCPSWLCFCCSAMVLDEKNFLDQYMMASSANNPSMKNAYDEVMGAFDCSITSWEDWEP
jgi:hypothetical protein